MSLYQRGEVWWVYLSHKGRRIRRATGYRGPEGREKAQRYHDELRAELWTRKHSGRTWNDAVKEWLKAEPRSDEDKYRLKALTQGFADRPIDEITAEDLQSAIESRRGAKVKHGNAATFNRYRDIVRAILRLAEDKGWIRESPKLDGKKKPKGRIRFLSREEWARLKKALPDRKAPGAFEQPLRALVVFSLATGLRQKNATHLEWPQVDLQRAVCWIHPDQAKMGEAIGIPLSLEAQRVLKKQRGQHVVWVFPYKRKKDDAGAPLLKMNKAWRHALQVAGVTNFRWHDLRHTWASWHVQNGTRLEVLQELGGWKDLEMVRRYAHLAPEHLRAFAGAVDRNLRARAVA